MSVILKKVKLMNVNVKMFGKSVGRSSKPNEYQNMAEFKRRCLHLDNMNS